MTEYQSNHDELEYRLHKVKTVVFYQLTIFAVVLLIGIVWVIASIARQGAFKYMPLKLKVSLIGFLIVQIMYDLISVFCEKEFGIEICSKEAETIIQALKNIVYLSVDWLFASHYLRVASLFRMTFASHSLLDFDKVQRRKKWLLILDIAVYTAIFVLLIIKG